MKKRKPYFTPLGHLVIALVLTITFILGMLAGTLAYKAAHPEAPEAKAQQPAADSQYSAADSAAEKQRPEAHSITYYHEVPLREDLQQLVTRLSESYGLDPRIVYGVMFVESNFNSTAVGDDGKAFGLMQVWPSCHQEEMDELGCLNLLDAEQNAAVGIRILGKHYEYYGDIDKALMAYNVGRAGAEHIWFSEGEFSNSYTERVHAIADALTPYTVNY